MRHILFVFAIFLGACADRTAAPVLPQAMEIGDNQTIFVGTTRSIDADGRFGIGRSAKLHLLKLDISIPPNRAPGSISDGLDKPNPQKDFVIAARKEYQTPAKFQSALRQDLSRADNPIKEITVFVHGFNSSFADSSFRVAQLAHDLDVPSTTVSYAWPSRGHVLGYEYDADSALFARDGLQQMLETLIDSGPNRIVLVAHSMGGSLAVETLRQLELKTPGWSARNLSGVVLISPDVNADVFLSQTKAFKTLPQPFVVFTSQQDKALQLSARLRFENERLGSLKSVEKFAHLPIEFIDVSAFTDAGGGNHFVAGSSPALLALLKSSARLDQAYLEGRGGVSSVLPGRRRIFRRATHVVVSPGNNR